ncbi:hypothetical protein, variant [Verruconis gallopava]|uniref:Uncharacterized protein n=1 Tax=Verruconis gallopava TaxID=253628 RepID=A0A0D1ZZ21_9PEZI|nr:uncharacterized protein PV09_08731 [Verruconis gallopava]XP_016209548.1 hypothetical protein, variant [Verruconis gallopava]KIV99677.1 hypothetical protein PV09_08731 [Verruconis gallopava]KIV99678.1 hypothetical protein, variant [Verruconis gallopava]
MAEDIDPYDWTLDQVVDAFCYKRTLWQEEQPNAILPDPVTLERLLRLNHIYGAALLTEVTPQVLKDDLSLKSLGQRSSISWAIRRLQARSRKFIAQQSAAALSLHGNLSAQAQINQYSTPLPFTPFTPHQSERNVLQSPFSIQSDAHASVGTSPGFVQPALLAHPDHHLAQSPSRSNPFQPMLGTGTSVGEGETDAVSLKRRAGETVIEDGAGRKKRRLDLSAMMTRTTTTMNEASQSNNDADLPSSEATATFTAAQASQPTSPSPVYLPANTLLQKCGLEPGITSFLGKKKFSFETMFFGSTRYGKELNIDVDCKPLIKEGSSVGETLIYHGSANTAVYGLQMVMNRKMMSFLRRDPYLNVNTKDESMAFYPYSATPSQSTESRALIHIMEESGIVIAKRTKLDQVLYADSGLNFDDTTSNHDWDFLSHWQRERGEKEDAILPAYGDSESEDDVELDSLVEELERDEEEDAEETRKLDAAQVEKIIEDTIADQVTAWREKRLPVLQDRALATWKKGRSGHHREKLARLAEQEIARLDASVAKLSRSIANDTWTRGRDVRAQCESIEPTVHWREEEKFKLSVWRNPKAPPPPSGQLLTCKKRNSYVSSNPGEHVLDSDEEVVDNRPGLDTFIDVDELVPLDLTAFKAQDETESHGADTNQPVQSEQAQLTSLDELGERTRSQDENRSELDSATEMLSQTKPKDDSTVDAHVDETVKVEPFSGPVFPELDKTCLPDKYMIDLTFDSDTELPLITAQAGPSSRRTRAQSANKDFSDHPEDDPDESVALWDWVVLQENTDRVRVIIKLIREMPAFEYKRLREHVLEDYGTGQRPKIYELGENIEKVLRTRLGLAANFEMAEFAFDRAVELLHLYVCWLESSPVHFREGYDLNEQNFKLVDLEHQLLQNAFAQTRQDESEDLGECLQYIYSTFFRHEHPLQSAKEDDNSDIELQEIDSHEADGAIPRKQRKRHVEESQAALSKRQKSKQKAADWKDRTDTFLQQSHHQSSQLGTSAGDIVVNTGKEEDDPEIFISPHIAPALKPHQIDGIRFMWREIVGTADDSDEPQGCLLAHNMGLGKTLQVIAFIDTLARAARSEDKRVKRQVPKKLRAMRVLILSPAGLISNWVDEFMKWNKAESAIGEPFVLTAQTTTMQRLELLKDWYNAERGSVLLMSYELFRNWEGNKKAGKNYSSPFSEKEHEEVKKQLLGGPSLVVADEAHKLKNHTSAVTIAAQKLSTKSRIALTGTPLSNNLLEYYAMVDWISKDYLGGLVEFKANYIEPIENGLYLGSSRGEYRRARIRMAALIAMLEPKIDRREIDVLAGSLKPKVQFVLKVPLTPLQFDVYDGFVQEAIGEIGDSVSNARLWGFMSYLQLLCGHPSLFRGAIVEARKKQKALDEKRAKDASKKQAKSPLSRVVDERPGNSPQSNDDEETDNSDDTKDDVDDDGNAPADSISLQIAERLFNKLVDKFEPILAAFHDAQFSYKVSLLLKIVEKSRAVGDKLLIFSHRIPTLDFLGQVLKKSNVRCERLDGSTSMNKRLQMTKNFNKGNEYDVCLISTRAGGVGFNLYGANRVILFDFSFNPTWEEQAIGRAFRLGQEKPVFVYRFISTGTFEEKLFDKTIFKLQLSYNVVEKKHTKSRAVRVQDYIETPKKSKLQDFSSCRGNDGVLDAILDEMEEGKELVHHIALDTTFKEEIKENLDEEGRKEMEMLVQQNQLRITDPQAYASQQLKQQQGATAARFNMPSSAARPDHVTGIPSRLAQDATLAPPASAPVAGTSDRNPATLSPSLTAQEQPTGSKAPATNRMD